MGFQQKIINLAQLGPLQPVKVAKELNTNSLVASAMLSELKSKGKLNISNLKIGSSPLYYLPEKKQQLETFSNFLNEKEKKTYFLLKEKQVLRNSDMDPLTKVCLQQIKDFAEAIQVSYQGNSEIFWKWYSLENSLFEEKIKAVLHGNTEKTEVQENETEEKQAKQSFTPNENKLEQEESDEIEESSKDKQKTLKFQDEYFDFIERKKIKVLDILTKKLREKDLIVEIPSNIGSLTYFCKIKNKKLITDSDISKAFLQGQAQKLPVLILSTGSLNKKAVELMDNLRGIVFSKVYSLRSRLR